MIPAPCKDAQAPPRGNKPFKFEVGKLLFKKKELISVKLF